MAALGIFQPSLLAGGEPGSDSVAWHSDRVGRTHRQPLVAIVALDGPRRFLLRPRGGGRSRAFEPAHRRRFSRCSSRR
ncbi:MAG: hypothetical protein J4F99_05850 [Acidimicrobiia bacterium]|nr:hypothetical protein [Acidimicrobiia bacterium]